MNLKNFSQYLLKKNDSDLSFFLRSLVQTQEFKIVYIIAMTLLCLITIYGNLCVINMHRGTKFVRNQHQHHFYF